jgi:hypothetical protein
MLARRHIGERNDDMCVMCDTGSEQMVEHFSLHAHSPGMLEQNPF